MGTAIEWTDTVWNPVTGCSKVSEGCRNCYAFALHDMRHKAFQEGKKLPQQYAKPFSKIQLFPDRLVQPMKWKKSKRVFVNSMADLFHNDVPDDFIWNVFDIMAKSPQHTFQVLTKRPDRMMEMLSGRYWRDLGTSARPYFARIIKGEQREGDMPFLPNVWLGTSVENQKAADERVQYLLETPAAVRFLSCEPLLGQVDLEFTVQFEHPDNEGYGVQAIKGIDWIIVGGESGPNARPMHSDWVESLRDQCEEYGVPFFFKQWGEWVPFNQMDTFPGHETRTVKIGKQRAGRLLDGQEWNQFPDRGERDAN
ncbi:phage Gp37/Gp68 family protein [Brevibacillus porteri]|uniref:Phage Gp37/Gp68 family protein n=1 Tax=Brevibacillus porteri TaxID=2126350 RepID=A0ABX5FI21_9BACL|nr:phage Gp37/Gp68 family protein [Brevibacillus porteri]MED1802084.1 phage Gp37/Gp68 family protein [Brevibacillus porteri]MED2133150.1 phage Gp37/Gp68 family protein [Brevibacillus porteri]MED2748683.1 phage Gp37/Gp68 family protein [Brevibacillus porteri]MED2813355.1 phage Gp37/Gp68 family protein [Brevibacillus porteri]MED4899542.1 phage Gp37/Gp68 family protein [Brevibacillus porteri]